MGQILGDIRSDVGRDLWRVPEGTANRSPIVIAWNIADVFLIVGINVRRESIKPPPTTAARSAPLGIGWWGV